MHKLTAGELIHQIDHRLGKVANEFLKEEAVTFPQTAMLLHLAEANPPTLSFKELEKKMGLAQSTTVGFIARLEKKGFLTVSMDENDRRVKYATLTDAGLHCACQTIENMRCTEDVFFAALSGDEREQLYNLLEKVVNSWKSKA